MSTDNKTLQKSTETAKADSASNKINFKSMLSLVIGAVKSPFEALTKNIEPFANFKNSVILMGIVALLSAIINVVTAMIIAVNSNKIVKSLFGSSSTSKNTLNWDALGEIEYGAIIFRTLLAYVLIILLAAGIYYVASSVVKKQANFSKLIAVAAVAVLFYLVISQVVAVLLMKLSPEVGLFVSKAGLIYALVLAYEGMNFQIFGNNADKQKIFMNIAALLVIAILFYYINKELLSEASIAEAASRFNSVNDLLKSLK